MTDQPATTETPAAPVKPVKLSPVEGIKTQSNFLRGVIAKELKDGNPAMGKTSEVLLKFHGTYQQDDRDSRKEAKKAGGKAFSYMVRSRIPGGKLSAAQMLAHLDMCDQLGNQTLRVTTRQGLQLHGILKDNLWNTIHWLNQVQITTLAACGDVNRNVLSCPAPYKQNKVRDQMQQLCDELTAHLLPKTRAYHEIWVTDPETQEKELVAGGEPEPDNEPLYGPTYMPRKFKTTVSLPEDNCVDAYANDLSFLGIHDGHEIQGWNVACGGGMGVTPAAKKTFVALAKDICFVTPDQAVKAAEAVLKLQRDNGNRSDRKVARLKYVLANWGVEKFKAVMEEYFGGPLAPPRPMVISDAKDHLGWEEQGDGKFFYGLYVENGRIKDEGDYRLKAALRAVFNTLPVGVRLTCHQNILFTDVEPAAKGELIGILKSHGIPVSEERTPMRRLSMACPAWPTCGLAITESERVHPELMDHLDAEMARLGLEKEVFSLHMTGCPNGCARPYNCDVGIVGKTLGKYTIYVGGNTVGTRLSFVYRDLVPQAEVIPTLVPLLERFAHERHDGERFGDFCHRLGPAGVGAGAEAEVEEEAE